MRLPGRVEVSFDLTYLVKTLLTAWTAQIVESLLSVCESLCLQLPRKTHHLQPINTDIINTKVQIGLIIGIDKSKVSFY